MWGIVFGVIQAAAPLGFWWLAPATVYALSLVLIVVGLTGHGCKDLHALTPQAAPGPAFALPVAFSVACDAFDGLANEPGAMACSRLVSCRLDAPGAGRRQPLGLTKRRRDGGKATALLRLRCSLLLPE